MSQVAKVFKLNWQGFRLRRGAIVAVIMGLLIIVGVLPYDRRYFLSAIFGLLCVTAADPGGSTRTGCRAWPSSRWPVRC